MPKYKKKQILKTPPANGSDDYSISSFLYSVSKHKGGGKNLLVPKDKQGWMEYMKTLARERVEIEYLEENDLENVIILAKRVICARKKNVAVKDPDLPEWYFWSKEQVAEWLEKSGISNLKDMFLINGINGRNLGRIDALALEKMGLKYFKDIKEAMKKIRELQGFQYPNSMRAHTRRLEFEEFTKFNVKTGEHYDLYTFQQFCIENGYPYDGSTEPKVIPCTCPVSIAVRTKENLNVKSDDSFGSKSSLEFAPTVEFMVRTIIIRNRIIDTLLEELLRAAFPAEEVEETPEELTLEDSMHCKLVYAFEELGIEDTELCALDQLAFATSVAKEFIQEILKTKELLENMDEFRNYIGTDIPSEVILEFSDTAKEFLEKAAPAAAILGLMKLDLEMLLIKKEVMAIERAMYPPKLVCFDSADSFGEE